MTSIGQAIIYVLIQRGDAGVKKVEGTEEILMGRRHPFFTSRSR